MPSIIPLGFIRKTYALIYTNVTTNTFYLKNIVENQVVSVMHFLLKRPKVQEKLQRTNRQAFLTLDFPEKINW